VAAQLGGGLRHPAEPGARTDAQVFKAGERLPRSQRRGEAASWSGPLAARAGNGRSAS
jgi:hypothetical protein